MPRTIPSPRHELVVRSFFLVASLVLAYLFWQVIQPFALVLITAGVMAIILTPLERRLRHAVRSAKLSSFLMVFLVLLLVVGPLTAAGYIMVNQAIDLAAGIDGSVLDAFRFADLAFFSSLPSFFQVQLANIDFHALAASLQGWVASHVGIIFSSSASFLFNAAIFFICLFYFLLEREKIVTQLLALSPFKDKTDRSILHRVTATVRGVVLGSLIVAVVQGVMAAIGMTIFHVPGALIWAGLVIIAAQVPVFGTAAVMIPVILSLLLTGNTSDAIGLTIWSVIVVGSIDNLLAPFLVGGRTRMHALLILLTILGGIQFFGPIGFIVGPTVLAAFLALVELYKAGVLEKNNL